MRKFKQSKYCLLLILWLVTPLSLATETKIPPDFRDSAFNCGKTVKGTDYRRTDYKTNELRRKVEGAHFTKGVQRGEYGNAGSLEGDLNYVLNKFPNHPKALLVAAKNQMRPDYTSQHKLRKDRFWPKKECYFQHALNRAPDDGLVHLVIAIFYHQYKNYEVAARHYQEAVKFAPENPEAHYNFGLFLMQVGEESKALEHAKKAYSMGYPLPGLKNMLIAVNKWEEK
ncbi:tetratricopeptide repeat protein [Aliiglaciecola sp. SL4]|uniref:tetratricopeptide repeat protein n=1 Tax=Aliiglaciecola sp. SL4 TaxID=3239806 RepID=UPI00355B0C34